MVFISFSVSKAPADVGGQPLLRPPVLFSAPQLLVSDAYCMRWLFLTFAVYSFSPLA